MIHHMRTTIRSLTLPLGRGLSSDTGLTHVFDRELFCRHRDLTIGLQESDYYDYLRIEGTSV
jgi:hypothetical protein